MVLRMARPWKHPSGVYQAVSITSVSASRTMCTFPVWQPYWLRPDLA
jgi:hypothetical protein